MFKFCYRYKTSKTQLLVLLSTIFVTGNVKAHVLKTLAAALYKQQEQHYNEEMQIYLYYKAALLKQWVAIPWGVTRCNLAVTKKLLGCPEKNVVFGRRSLKIQKHLRNKYIFNQSKLHKIEYICANVGQCHRCLFYKSHQILSQERSFSKSSHCCPRVCFHHCS